MPTYFDKLPQEWPLISLGAVSEIGIGDSAPQGEMFFSSGTHLFVRMQDVGRCLTPYITTTTDRINDLALKQHRLRKWPSGSLLIPKSGASVALNKRALLKEDSFVVSHLAVVVPGQLIDSEYVYYLSCTLDMMRLALDPGYPSLRTSDISKLRIPLPTLSEQKRIITILKDIEQINSYISDLESKTTELLPAVFVSMFGDLSENTRNWPVMPLSEFVSEFEGVKVCPTKAVMCPGVLAF
jgi:restriction endonuclease S subunit